MKVKTIIVLAFILAGVSACEKKMKPVAPILPAASTKEEFLAMFPQTCIAAAKSIKIAEVDEEELTVEQLKNGCTCATDMLSQKLTNPQWENLVKFSSTHSEPGEKLNGRLHEVLTKCFVYAVGPE